MKSTRNTTHAIRNENGQFAAQVATPRTQVIQELVNLNLEHWNFLEAHGFTDVQPNELFSTPARPQQRVNWNG